MLPIISALLIALGTTITTLFSPLLGLIFVIAIGGNWFIKNFEKKSYLVIWLIAVPVMFYFAGFITHFDLFNIALGVVVIAFLHFAVLLKTLSFKTALVSATIGSAVFALIRLLLFKEYYATLLDEGFAQSFALLEKAWAGSEESMQMLQTLKSASAGIKQNLINYQVALWVVPSTIGIAIGCMVLSKISALKWFYAFFKVNKNIVWLLIPFLGLTAFATKVPILKVIAYNGLAIFAGLYLIQGFAIINFFWRIWFAKSKFFTIILIAAIILNPYLLPLVILTGLLDTWFNFRKIREEPDEDYSNWRYK